jgi:hypothetical protein
MSPRLTPTLTIPTSTTGTAMGEETEV